jgi:ABC-type multidrug transport system fused ATPase/permease subunit
MISIERVKDYSKINSEFDDNEMKKMKLEDNWLKYGSIRFEDVTFSYDEKLPKVLKNCNLEVKPMEKISVVGRTGKIT